MGREFNYLIKSSLEAGSINHLMKTVKLLDGLDLLDEQGNTLYLRYKGSPERKEWKEDIEIDIGRNNLYLCFHSGTKSQVELILHAISNELDKMGISFNAEED